MKALVRYINFKNKQVLVLVFFSDQEIIYHVEICLHLMFKVR